jgi:hypothetical protein
MQEGKAWRALKKLNDRGTRVEPLLVRPPCLQRGAGHVQDLGSLTLRDALSMQIAIPLTERSAFEAIPPLVVILVASLRILDYCAHSYLLFHPSPWYRDG